MKRKREKYLYELLHKCKEGDYIYSASITTVCVEKYKILYIFKNEKGDATGVLLKPCLHSYFPTFVPVEWTYFETKDDATNYIKDALKERIQKAEYIIENL